MVLKKRAGHFITDLASLRHLFEYEPNKKATPKGMT